MPATVEEQIQEMADKETAAWNAKDAEALVSLFHPDMVWPWPPDANAHDPEHWVFPMGRYDRKRWKAQWEQLFRTHDLAHNRRKTVRITVSEQEDGAFAVVDVDTLWRNRVTGETFHWKGRAGKGYTKVHDRWFLIFHTGLLDYHGFAHSVLAAEGQSEKMNILVTERLNLRELTPEDAGFMLKLLNEPSFLQNIGDRGVRNLEDARRFILKGPVESYKRFGFGMWLAALREAGTPIGICGLVKRDFLADVDIGFAFLPHFWSKGYAYEAAAAVKVHALDILELKRLAAIVNPDNIASVKVLEKIGLQFERMIRLPDSGEEIRLFGTES